MKKYIFISVVVLIFMIGLAGASYDSGSKVLTLNLKQGWSAVPILIGEYIDSSCGFAQETEEFVGLGYIYASTTNEYILYGTNSNSGTYNSDLENGYFYTAYGGSWVYLTRDCDITFNDYTPLGPSSFKMAQGWELVSKTSWMADAGFDAFANCNIEKFNQWDEASQDWMHYPSNTNRDELSTAFNQAEVGDVIFMKFVEECTLDIALESMLGIPTPPSLD